jgi:hypothetical protein
MCIRDSTLVKRYDAFIGGCLAHMGLGGTGSAYQAHDEGNAQQRFAP